MKSAKNKRSVTVGIFIFLGIVILIVTVFTLGSQKKAFIKAVPVKTVFEDVSGLQVGDNVWLSGLKIGIIKKLSFVPNTGVEVTMNLDAHVVPLIHRDSKTKISSNGLMGNKIVVIFGGAKNTPHVKENDVLESVKPISTEDMLAVLQENNKSLLVILSNFKDVSNKIAAGKGTLGSLLNDSSMAKDMRATIASLRSTVAKFNATATQSEKAVTGIADFTTHLNKQGTLMNDLVTDTTIFADLRATVSQLKHAADTASQITNDIKSATTQLTKKNNAVGAVLNDEEFALRLKSTITNLDSASKNLNEDLIALQHNFFFKGYFKKKKK
jgi:phospholipid/cholesterol/gamma-HCH transport system substrate-binding protein